MGEFQIDRTQLIGFVGVILLIVGVFVPIVHLPIVGSISYVANGRGDGWLVLLLAISAAGLLFVRKYSWVLVPTISATGICAFTLWNFSTVIADIQEKSQHDLRGNPFAGLAQAIFASVGLEWGWALLFLGLLCLFVAALFPYLSGGNRNELKAPLLVSGAVVGLLLLGISTYTYFKTVPDAAESSASVKPNNDSILNSAPAINSDVVEMSKAVKVMLTKKEYLPSNYEAGRYRDRVQFTFEIQNMTAKDIAGVKGTVDFLDIFGSPIESLRLSFDEDVKAGSSRIITGYGKDLNQFISEDQKLAVTDFTKMKARFVPEMIVFADGSKIGGTEEADKP